MRPQFAVARCAVVACAALLASCATTIDDTGSPTASADVADAPVDAEPGLDSAGPVDGGTIVDPDAPTPTVAPSGSAVDLLPDLSAEMGRLGSEIAEGGDSKATFARIEQIWDRVRAEVEADRPELVDGFDATIDMARIAVERRRPADADKAFALVTDLVDRFLTP